MFLKINKKSNRRIARERVLQVLYAYQMNGEGLEILLNSILADVDSEIDRKFARDLTHAVLANLKSIDAKIEERINNWEIDRIALIDRLLLQIGIAELNFFPDIPPKVSINEVIEISKDFSTSNSGKFINGILDSILSELKNSGTIKKTGRGLIEETLGRKDR